MPINYIPNDPLVQSIIPMRQKSARANRASTRAGFTFPPAPPKAVFSPGTPEFLFWQCREAALTALSVWEGITGKITSWARSSNPKKLALQPNAGEDLNAYYDGQSLSFFEFTTGSKTTFSGASTDVVAHESGHAVLDSLRPELWDDLYIEVGSFHEAFGDCTAILTALSDQVQRTKLRSTVPDLDAENFLEATAEDLSDGVRRELGATHPAAKPRHARNNFVWQLPSTLPKVGPPDVLSSEIHSFARVFSGCFYDLIRLIYTSSSTRSDSSLRAAVRTAGKLLGAAARQAPVMPRFFRSVGRTMALVDQSMNNGANRQAIHDAFDRHGLALGSSSLLAPNASLAGPAPRLAARAAALSTATHNDLKRRLGIAPGARLLVQPARIAGQVVALACSFREVKLAPLGKELAGVVALAPERVLVGAVAGSAALLSGMPDPYATEDEVHAFVATLMKTNNIAFGREGRAAGGRRDRKPTHTVVSERGRKVLRRARFACPACGCGWPHWH